MTEKKYFQDTELLEIAQNCNDFDELKDCADALKYLYEEGEYIKLALFDTLSHKRLKQIHSQL